MKDKNDKNIKYSIFTDNMLFFGTGLAIIYWCLESFVSAMLYDEIGFFYQLFGYDLSGVLLRMLALCFFMIFGSHAQYTINRRKEMEEALKENNELISIFVKSVETAQKNQGK